jgi:hypothetical protein
LIRYPERECCLGWGIFDEHRASGVAAVRVTGDRSLSTARIKRQVLGRFPGIVRNYSGVIGRVKWRIGHAAESLRLMGSAEP